MTRISPHARTQLQRFRSEEQLDPLARERLCQALLDKVARGETALTGIDASPLVLPKVSWVTTLLGGGATKLVLFGVGVVAIGLASLLVWRAEPPVQKVAAPAPAPARDQSQAATDQAAQVAHSATPTEPSTTGNTGRREGGEPEEAFGFGRNARSARIAGPRGAGSSAQSHRRPHALAGAKPDVTPAPVNAASGADSVSTVASPAAVGHARATEAERAAEPAAPEPPEAPPPPAKTVAPAYLDAELGLLRGAYSALNAGKPADAFALLDEHAARFPHGSLEQAREVARMLALCAMGRERPARARAQAFLATYPDSPFVGRVRGICPAPGKKLVSP